eukprot:6163961-Alexandrium_andersonii.AAC.1
MTLAQGLTQTRRTRAVGTDGPSTTPHAQPRHTHTTASCFTRRPASPAPPAAGPPGPPGSPARTRRTRAVSYTHLTLPTICSV